MADLPRRIGIVAVPSSATVFAEINVACNIVAYVGHDSDWRPLMPWRHYGNCGQNCPCCRAANDEDWPSGCGHCLDLWYLSLADKRIRLAVAWQSTYYSWLWFTDDETIEVTPPTVVQVKPNDMD